MSAFTIKKGEVVKELPKNGIRVDTAKDGTTIYRYTVYDDPKNHRRKLKDLKKKTTTQETPEEKSERKRQERISLRKEHLANRAEDRQLRYQEQIEDGRRDRLRTYGEGIASVAQNLYGPETIGYTAGNVASTLLANPATRIPGLLTGLFGAGWQVYETFKKWNKQKKKDKMDTMNEENNYMFPGFNAEVGLNQLRHTLANVHYKKQFDQLRKAYEKRSILNKMDAIQEMSMRAIHNKKKEAYDIQQSIDDHLMANYREAKARQDERSQKQAIENKFSEPDPRRRDLGQLAKEIGGPIGQGLSMIDYLNKQQPFYTSEPVRNDIFSDEALADNLYDQYLNRSVYDLTTPKEITSRDRREYYNALNKADYITAASNEGITMWSHPEEFETMISKHEFEYQNLWNNIKLGTEFASKAINFLIPFIIKGPSAALEKLADMLNKENGMDQKVKDMVYGDVSHQIEQLTSARKNIMDEFDLDEQRNMGTLKRAEDIFGLINDVRIHDWEKERDWYNMYYKGFTDDDLKYFKGWINFLDEKQANKDNWLTYIKNEEDLQTNKDLIPNTSRKRSLLKSLKEVATAKEPIELYNDDQLRRYLQSKQFMKNEFNDPFFDYHKLDDADWRKTIGKAWIDNDEGLTDMLRERKIESFTDIDNRMKVIREKALTDDIPADQIQQYINQAMLLPQKDFEERILRPLADWKVKKGLHVGDNLFNIVSDTVKSYNNQRKLKKQYNQDNLEKYLKRFQADAQGSYARFRQTLIKKDLMDEFGTNIFTGKDFLELKPEVQGADARRNHWLLEAHNLLSAIGWGSATENEELLNDPDVLDAFTSDKIYYAIEKGNDGKNYSVKHNYMMWEAKAHEDEKDYEKNKDKLVRLFQAAQKHWVGKGLNPRYRYYNGHEYNAGEVDSTVRTPAEKERDFINDYLNKKFTDSDSPVVKRYRAEQKAAILEGYHRFEDEFADILDGMDSLDNIRPEKIHNIDSLSDPEKRNHKHLDDVHRRREYGQQVFTDETNRLDKMRRSYNQFGSWSDKTYEHDLARETPILLNSALDLENGSIDQNKFKQQAQDIFYRSAERYDPKNEKHKRAANSVRLIEWPEAGQSKRLDDLEATIFTRRGANGRDNFFVWFDGDDFMINIPLNSPVKPHIADKNEFARQTLKHKAANIKGDEVDKATAQQRAERELRIAEIAKVKDTDSKKQKKRKMRKAERKLRAQENIEHAQAVANSEDPIASQHTETERKVFKQSKEQELPEDRTLIPDKTFGQKIKGVVQKGYEGLQKLGNGNAAKGAAFVAKAAAGIAVEGYVAKKALNQPAFTDEEKQSIAEAQRANAESITNISKEPPISTEKTAFTRPTTAVASIPSPKSEYATVNDNASTEMPKDGNYSLY